MTPRSARLILLLDLIGTFVFAVEGAAMAMTARLDVFGVMVISFVTALGGGIVRDLLIAAAPPQALRDWRYPVTAFAAGLLTFGFFALLRAVPEAALIALDAGGLALFAIAGAEKSLSLGMNGLAAVLMGGVTGVGGGVVRDVLLNKIPAILQTDIYATAALLGAAILVIGQKAGLSARRAAALGVLSCFVLRLTAAWLHWNLPQAA